MELVVVGEPGPLQGPGPVEEPVAAMEELVAVGEPGPLQEPGLVEELVAALEEPVAAEELGAVEHVVAAQSQKRRGFGAQLSGEFGS